MAAMFSFSGIISAEGTKQLEPSGAPFNSVCRIALTQNSVDNRIPFALLNCNENYRLNIHINDFTSEKIYMGFGNVIDYFDETINYFDVNYQVKDPAGNIVSGYSLQLLPGTPSDPGFIETRSQADLGPDINSTNPGGYYPLTLNPAMNGDYVLEFSLPGLSETEIRVFKYIDVTVANGDVPIKGRLWSKAWQLSSSSVIASEHASFSKFYIYTNDSIVTRFDCNGLAGGVWAIYSNEWGCATTGTWSDRRRSIEGNASVQPQYKIFLNDPDPPVFPSGHIGEMLEFKVLPFECDTVITFWANLTKGGNIEIMLDIPPLNPGGFGPEDVQLGYNVTAGANTLVPAWDGRNGYGVPLVNGMQVEARISFLNGLSNLPLFDVEDNPSGFKVDIQRPMPVSGSTILKLYWDDYLLPGGTINEIQGCEYTGIEPLSGCHDWPLSLGNLNTMNSWWYYSTGDILNIPITLKLSPASGNIIGPLNICAGQQVTFRTTSIPFAQKYIWHLSGQGISIDIEKDAPDTTFFQQFTSSMPQGVYTISVFGRNQQCGDGDTAFLTAFVFDNQPPPVTGIASVCNNSTYQYELPGSYTNIQWSLHNGDIIGPANVNPVTIRWHTSGIDSIEVLATSVDCGTRLSSIQVNVHPVAIGVIGAQETTSCPGMPLTFSANSTLESGSVIKRYWDWGDSNFIDGNDTLVTHSFSGTGNFTVKLKLTTDQGCETETSTPIRIIPFPEALFSCYSNCISQAIQLTDISTGIDLATREWDFGTAPVTTADLTQQQPEAVFHSTGQYPVRLIVTNQYGCTDTLIKQVDIHNRPVAAFTHETPCQSAGIIFADQSTPADTILTGYAWNTQSISGEQRTFTGNPTVISFNDVANYTVSLQVTDFFGCVDTVAELITVKPKPESSFEYIENSGNIMGQLHFENTTTGASSYYWDFGNSITSQFPQPDIKYNDEGEYTIMLVATSIDGCNDTATSKYYYMPGLWMPNAFTPDNDGLNDYFKPVTQRNTLEPYLLLIYNRWGQQIFKSSTPSIGWDGNFNGEPCEEGIYSYVVQFREEKKESTKAVTQRGTVSLLR
jgi:gliding motility-associated-like protein